MAEQIEMMMLEKKNALQIHGTQERYDLHVAAKRVCELIFTREFSHHNDSLKMRIEHNEKEIKKLLALLREKKIQPQILEYLAISSFYPSYVLHHHFNHFTQFIQKMGMASLLQQCRGGQAVGAIFTDRISKSFGKVGKASFKEGRIFMEKDAYFYSLQTSPHLNICVVQAEKGIAVLRIKDQNGRLCPGVTFQDLGSTISGDYCCMGYRFENVTPIFMSEQRGALKALKKIKSEMSVCELGYSLQDLMTSLNLAVKYTSMRKQFSTHENSRAERRIIEYQAVAGRIIDGFSYLYLVSFLREKMLTMPGVAPFVQLYLPLLHQTILTRVMSLRECCGGFGFLRVSGFPSIIERLSLRSAQSYSTFIPEHPELMKRIMYYSSDESLMHRYIEELGEKQSLLSLFSIICIMMKKRKDELSKDYYVRQFIIQISIQLMNRSLSFIPSSQRNAFNEVLSYVLTTYILDNAKYLPFERLKRNPQQFVMEMMERRNSLLTSLQKKIPELLSTIEAGIPSNVIGGCDKEDQFYEKVLAASKSNKNNDVEFRKFVQKPLVELMREQRAKM